MPDQKVISKYEVEHYINALNYLYVATLPDGKVVVQKQ